MEHSMSTRAGFAEAIGQSSDHVEKHQFFDGGFRAVIPITDKLHLSVVNGKGAYCDSTTVEIAVQHTEGDVIGDVAGYIEPSSIHDIAVTLRAMHRN